MLEAIRRGAAWQGECYTRRMLTILYHTYVGFGADNRERRGATYSLDVIEKSDTTEELEGPLLVLSTFILYDISNRCNPQQILAFVRLA